MLMRTAADAVVLLHLGFIIFALFGALLALRWSRLVCLHLPAAAWAVYIELSGKACPLTYIENDLRQQAGQQGYAGGFVEHYLLPVIYPTGLTPAVQFVLAGVVLVVNLMLYGWLWRRRR
ncbi:DUF2784 family protein [Pseudoduganella sp. DS3]|uniref:DUF2784 family protein n=2 Tax=Pseudoduganella guangdongensis TaxID=2692179 RepID=A0A6N9HHL2_9BURK|nr:DUF2784 domain-containing protein [Pseudoduganella guangdongensis]MYN02866.1 DUF2784 family protein [Pseudoduganella guangdongensis]